MSNSHPPAAHEEQRYHTYVTHHIPWYVRAAWIAFWVGMIWYLLAYAVPNARNYF